jgi:hypothetical protein
MSAPFPGEAEVREFSEKGGRPADEDVEAMFGAARDAHPVTEAV